MKKKGFNNGFPFIGLSRAIKERIEKKERMKKYRMRLIMLLISIVTMIAV